MTDTIEIPQPAGKVGSIGCWIAWAAATIFVAYQLATQNSIAGMQASMEKDLGLAEWEISIVSASFLFVYAVMQVPAGMLLDRYRPRLLLPPMAIGVAAAALMLSAATGFWSAVAARALMGIFAAFAFPGAGLVARRRLPVAQFAIAMGLIDMAFGFGGWIGLTGVEFLMQWQSWRAVMVDLAIIGGIVAVLCFVCISNTTARGNVATESARSRSMIQSMREVLGVRQVRLAAVTAGTLMAVLFGFGGLWDVPLQQAFGYSHGEAVTLNGWIFIGAAIMPPIVGWAADRWRIRRPILMGGMVFALIAALAILLVPGHGPQWQPTLMLLALGLGIGTCVLTFPIACDAVDPANVGAAIGVVNAAGLLSAAMFQIVPGAIFAAIGSQSLCSSCRWCWPSSWWDC